MVGDDLLAQPDRIVGLRREVEAPHLLRHQRDEGLLLIVAVDVVELNLNVRRRRQRILVEILLRACGLGLLWAWRSARRVTGVAGSVTGIATALRGASPQLVVARTSIGRNSADKMRDVLVRILRSKYVSK